MASIPGKNAQKKIGSPARYQGLTVKQQRAVETFVATGSMIKAYKAAYDSGRMSQKTLYARAKELFENPRVAARVQALRQQSMDGAILDRQEALAILSDIARGHIGRYLDDDGAIDPRAIKAMGGSDIERLDLHTAQGRQKALLRMRDPIRAIERIARLEGWEEQERFGVGQVTFTIDMGPEPTPWAEEKTCTPTGCSAPGEKQSEVRRFAQDATAVSVEPEGCVDALEDDVSIEPDELDEAYEPVEALGLVEPVDPYEGDPIRPIDALEDASDRSNEQSKDFDGLQYWTHPASGSIVANGLDDLKA